MKRHVLLTILIVFTFLVGSVLFFASDNISKRYLNPIYLDVLVLFAGAFLLIEAYKHIEIKRFYSTALRSIIGMAIVTIHIWQFIFDFSRHGIS